MHATPDRLERLTSMGISFVSLGIQSFDEAMLRHLARPTSPETNMQAIEQAVGRFACVDADLIFDVAFEAPEVFLNDLERCFRYGVDQVSTYPLMRFGYTPFGKAPHDARAEHDVLRRASDARGALGIRSALGLDVQSTRLTLLHLDHPAVLHRARGRWRVVHRAPVHGERIRGRAVRAGRRRRRACPSRAPCRSARRPTRRTTCSGRRTPVASASPTWSGSSVGSRRSSGEQSPTW